MKRILLSTIILTGFTLSIILFEISCKKSANAQSSVTITQEGKVLFINPDGSIGVANYDGTNQQTLNIVLPTGLIMYPYFGSLSISPDHQTIFFGVQTTGGTGTNSKFYGYSCNRDGGNVRKVTNSTINVPF